ncbi:MAG: DCC1-like thiol-disulfide oxidoreductase family protein [Methyloceanibacter sp.]
MNLERELAKDSRIAIVYDGDCPLCSTYVIMTRLRNAVGTPTLLNARARPDLVKALAGQGASLDTGLAVYYEGRIYTGGEAMHVLAFLTTPVGFANRLTAALLRRRSFALRIYPFLRAGRNLLLRIRNRPQLETTA